MSSNKHPLPAIMFLTVKIRLRKKKLNPWRLRKPFRVTRKDGRYVSRFLPPLDPGSGLPVLFSAKIDKFEDKNKLIYDFFHHFLREIEREKILVFG